MQNKRPFLSIIIPVYNEEERIKNIFEIYDFFKKQKISFEIIIVNDGSTDSTRKHITKINKKIPINFIRSKKNRGKGFSIKKGISISSGKYKLFMDIDLSTPLDTFIQIYPQIKECDIFVATRRLDSSKIILHQSFMRESMGKFFTYISQIITGTKISDFTCGYKLFSEKASSKIFPYIYSERWSFDTEIIMRAKKNNLSIKEIPVHWKNDSRSKVNFPLDVFLSLKELILIFIRK